MWQAHCCSPSLSPTRSLECGSNDAAALDLQEFRDTGSKGNGAQQQQQCSLAVVKSTAARLPRPAL